MDSYAEWLHTVKIGHANEVTVMKNSEGQNKKKLIRGNNNLHMYTECFTEKRISLGIPLKWDCLLLIRVSCL